MRKELPKIIMTAAVLLGALFLVLLLVAGGEKKKPRPPVHEKSVNPIWSESAIFNGDAPGQTAPFRIARGPWRLRWKTDGSPNSSSLGFTVLNDNQTLPAVVEENGLVAPDSGTIKIKQRGVFYILVSSYEASWKFTVESQDP